MTQSVGTRSQSREETAIRAELFKSRGVDSIPREKYDSH